MESHIEDWSQSRILFVCCSDLLQRGCSVWEFEIRRFEIVLYENIKSHFMQILKSCKCKIKNKKRCQSSFQINGETALPNGTPVTSSVPSR